MRGTGDVSGQWGETVSKAPDTRVGPGQRTARARGWVIRQVTSSELKMGWVEIQSPEHIGGSEFPSLSLKGRSLLVCHVGSLEGVDSGEYTLFFFFLQLTIFS